MSAQTLDHLAPAHARHPVHRTAPAAVPAAAPWGREHGAGLPAALPVTVRPARRSDLPGLARLLVASSPSTRLGWYGRGGGVLPLAQQEAWLASPGTLVVEAAPGRLVAVAALRTATCSGAVDTIASTVEVMVQDRWQRRGLATALLRHLAGVSLAAGRTEVQLSPESDSVAGTALLTALAARVGARARVQQHPHGRCARVHLPARGGAALAAADDVPGGRRPDPAAGLGAAWSMAVPTAARPRLSVV